MRTLIEAGLLHSLDSPGEAQPVLESLRCLGVIGPAIVPELNPQLEEWLTHLRPLLTQQDPQIRQLAAKTVVTLVKSRPGALINSLLR